jgi:N6-adenosine-specific RNA methylase IME4
MMQARYRREFWRKSLDRRQSPSALLWLRSGKEHEAKKCRGNPKHIGVRFDKAALMRTQMLVETRREGRQG